MKLEIHAHSHYSHQRKVKFDGVSPPAEMVAAAARAGLDAVALTDHDTMRGMAEAKKAAKENDIMLIPGEEVTTADGHVVALGISEAIPKGLPAEETVDRIHSQGGIAISSHPFDIGKYGLRKKALLCDAIEVFNAINHDRFSNRKSRRFAERNNLAGVASSDAHHPLMVGHGITETKGDDIDSALNAISKGRVTLHKKYIPVDVMMRWSVRRLQLSHEHTMKYILQNYTGPKLALSKFFLNLIQKSPGRVDVFLKAATYLGLSSAIVYSAVNEVLGQVSSLRMEVFEADS